MMEKKINKLKITIYGYDINNTDESTKLVAQKILQIKSNFPNLDFAGPIPFPTKTKRFSVLISPHKHKKSQEQFERNIHRRRFFLFNLSPDGLKHLEDLKIPNTTHCDYSFSN